MGFMSKDNLTKIKVYLVHLAVHLAVDKQIKLIKLSQVKLFQVQPALGFPNFFFLVVEEMRMSTSLHSEQMRWSLLLSYLDQSVTDCHPI